MVLVIISLQEYNKNRGCIISLHKHFKRQPVVTHSLTAMLWTAMLWTSNDTAV